MGLKCSLPWNGRSFIKVFFFLFFFFLSSESSLLIYKKFFRRLHFPQCKKIYIRKFYFPKYKSISQNTLFSFSRAGKALSWNIRSFMKKFYFPKYKKKIYFENIKGSSISRNIRSFFSFWGGFSRSLKVPSREAQFKLIILEKLFQRNIRNFCNLIARKFLTKSF